MLETGKSFIPEVELKKAFTLIELLVVVAIVAILSAIAVVNMRTAMERSYMASNTANLRTLATAFQIYLTDYGKLPPADRIAGPFSSSGPSFTTIGDGPAAGGSWDGVPWMLVDRGYVQNWETLFNPKHLKDYRSGTTIGGSYPRFHNFRYAYNASAVSSGGTSGGTGTLLTGQGWLLRDLFVGPQSGFYAASYPNYPADYDFPWGEATNEDNLEHAIYLDSSVKLVQGGTNILAN